MQLASPPHRYGLHEAAHQVCALDKSEAPCRYAHIATARERGSITGPRLNGQLSGLQQGHSASKLPDQVTT